ncbi:MAG: hypothetical protein H0U28_13510 [Nocardioidaceae bacterium]|nr:hypothetical protein [Nocardioidaceae bacterium]
MSLLIAVTGVAPGIGKSTLAAGLSDWLRSLGRVVDHFEEDEVLTRPQFAPLARELAVTGRVGLDTLQSTVSDFVAASTPDEGAVVVCDSLFPFVHSLIGWGYGEHAIEGFLSDLPERLAGVDLVVVYLDAEVDAALSRAAEREPDGWLDWFVDNLGDRDAGPTVRDIESAARYLDWERAITVRLMADQDWEVTVLADCDQLSESDLLGRAREALSPYLATGPDVPPRHDQK